MSSMTAMLNLSVPLPQVGIIPNENHFAGIVHRWVQGSDAVFHAGRPVRTLPGEYLETVIGARTQAGDIGSKGGSFIDHLSAQQR